MKKKIIQELDLTDSFIIKDNKLEVNLNNFITSPDFKITDNKLELGDETKKLFVTSLIENNNKLNTITDKITEVENKLSCSYINSIKNNSGGTTDSPNSNNANFDYLIKDRDTYNLGSLSLDKRTFTNTDSQTIFAEGGACINFDKLSNNKIYLMESNITRYTYFFTFTPVSNNYVKATNFDTIENLLNNNTISNQEFNLVLNKNHDLANKISSIVIQVTKNGNIIFQKDYFNFESFNRLRTEGININLESSTAKLKLSFLDDSVELPAVANASQWVFYARFINQPLLQSDIDAASDKTSLMETTNVETKLSLDPFNALEDSDNDGIPDNIDLDY